VVILMEGEIWPNFLNECARRGTFVAVMNGDLSPKSFRGYRALMPVLWRPLKAIRLFCMQTPVDVERMTALCGRAADVHVGGNVKFDNLPRALDESEREQLALELGYPVGRQGVLFGSTHPGEEELAAELL